MADNGTYGSVLLLVGIIIIGATFYLAFGLYSSFVSLAASPPQQNIVLPSGNVTTSTGIINAVIKGVVSSIPSNRLAYDTLTLLALLLFANIGYKLAKIGMDLMSVGTSSQQTEAQPQRKNRF